MREALYRALSDLPYQDRELLEVDTFLARVANQLGVRPEELQPEAMAHPQLADWVVFTKIRRVSRLYLFLYSQIRMDLDFDLVDTRTRQVFYRDRFVFRNRRLVPFYSLPGIANALISSLWHLRPEELTETMEEGTEQLAEAIPLAHFDAAAGEGGIRLSDVEVTVPGEVLIVGDRIDIRAYGSQGCEAFCSIGNVARDLPMTEVAPGLYQAAYVVRTGDQTPYAVVEVQLKHHTPEDVLDYVAAEQPFAIDTQPPARATVVAARWGNAEGGLQLQLEVGVEGHSAADDDPPVLFYIYRRTGGEKTFEWVGATGELNFRDAEALGGRTHDYYVITRDKAGNFSAPGPLIRFTIPPH